MTSNFEMSNFDVGCQIVMDVKFWCCQSNFWRQTLIFDVCRLFLMSTFKILQSKMNILIPKVNIWCLKWNNLTSSVKFWRLALKIRCSTLKIWLTASKFDVRQNWAPQVKNVSYQNQITIISCWKTNIDQIWNFQIRIWIILFVACIKHQSHFLQ